MPRVRASLFPWPSVGARCWMSGPLLVVFGLVVGGIYAGWFTPTEGAAIGAQAQASSRSFRANMTWSVFKESIIRHSDSHGMIFFIVLGAALYNGFPCPFASAAGTLFLGGRPRL